MNDSSNSIASLMDENKDLRFEIEQQLNIIEVSLKFDTFLINILKVGIIFIQSFGSSRRSKNCIVQTVNWKH